MIFNKNCANPETERKINEMVGNPYKLKERIKMKGVGTTKMLVKGMSEDLKHHFGANQDLKYVSLELRPIGVIIYIKSKINDYAWAIPFYKLSIYQSDFFSIHTDGKYLQLDLKTVYPKNKKIVNQILDARAKIDKLRVI